MAICNLYVVFNGLMLSCLKRGLVWANFGDDVMILMAFFDIVQECLNRLQPLSPKP